VAPARSSRPTHSVSPARSPQRSAPVNRSRSARPTNSGGRGNGRNK
jgi:hypothetical protein